MISRTLVLGLFYAIGYWIKRNSVELEEFDRPLLAIMAFGLFIIQGHYNSANMGANTYKYYFSFVFGALCASYGMIFLSRLICEVQSLRYLKNVLCYLSEKSIDIVIWQFVAFRLVIALQLYIEKISLKTILDYYPVYDVSDGWWLIYTVIGILVPILLGCVFHMPTNCKALICKSMLKREKVK